MNILTLTDILQRQSNTDRNNANQNIYECIQRMLFNLMSYNKITDLDELVSENRKKN